MSHNAYIDSDSTQDSVQRAASIANTNVSIFEYHINANPAEQQALTGCGHACASCNYVGNLPWGAQACRNSREKAATSALKRKKAVPYLCHMGFSCVAIPALNIKDILHVMHFGPFCPSEAPDSLTLDALQALEKLEDTSIDTLPFSLDDIPQSPAQTVPDIAQWLCETLTQQYALQSEPTKESSTLDHENTAPLIYNKRLKNTPLPAQYDAGAIVAALIGGDTKQARMMIYSQIDTHQSRKRTRIQVLRARTIAVVATVLEWAEQADTNTQLCWAKFPPFQEAIQTLDAVDDLSKAAIKVLTPIRREIQANRKKSTDTKYEFTPLNKLITKHFKDGITLNEVAQILDENPTTITKRLQRTFALSFSQYVGQMKIEHAKKLFRTTKLTIGQVAQRIGIQDSANFTKLFRAHAQLSPSQYRSQYGKNAQAK
jgi:AraC-like DNA-binding protein